MFSGKKNLFKSIFTANADCGCGRQQKLSNVHEPTPIALLAKPSINISCKDPNPVAISSSSSSLAEDQENTTSTSTPGNTLVSESDTDPLSKASKIVNSIPSKKEIVNSIAVVKDSNDPHQDFKHSMLQMVLEKKMYSREDLEDLLTCFLELNSACHHKVILEAFTEVWNELVAKGLIIINTTSSLQERRNIA